VAKCSGSEVLICGFGLRYAWFGFVMEEGSMVIGTGVVVICEHKYGDITAAKKMCSDSVSHSKVLRFLAVD
jgi:hypothetical protein